MSRRMFSDEVVASDAFLDMPSGSQLLYFHLGQQADDDGFISSPKMVMRVLGSTSDELSLLFAKKFLLPFDNGICVVKHWRINNFIRKDIYKPTRYQKEKSQLFIRKNGAYTFNPEGAIPIPKGHFILGDIETESDVNVTLTHSQRDVNLGKVRIGKVSSNNKDPSEKEKPEMQEISPNQQKEIIGRRSNIIEKFTTGKKYGR